MIYHQLSHETTLLVCIMIPSYLSNFEKYLINYIYIRKIKPLKNRKTGPIAQLGGAFD